MCEKLYGPGHGNRLIARSPVGVVIERKWVEEGADPLASALKGAPTPEDHEPEVDEDEADVQRLLAAAGLKKSAAGGIPAAPEGAGARATLAPSPPFFVPELQPSNSAAPEDEAEPVACGSTEAPASEVPHLAADGGAAAGSEETAAVEGAAASTQDTSGPGDGADVTHDEASADAVAASDPVEAPKAVGPDALAADFAQFWVGEVTPIAPLPGDAAAPWSKLEDRDLVGILRGKLLGIEEEDAANERRVDALQRELDALHERSVVLIERRNGLQSVIEIFTGEEEGTVDGEDSQQAEAAAPAYHRV